MQLSEIATRRSEARGGERAGDARSSMEASGHGLARITVSDKTVAKRYLSIFPASTALRIGPIGRRQGASSQSASIDDWSVE